MCADQEHILEGEKKIRIFTCEGISQFTRRICIIGVIPSSLVNNKTGQQNYCSLSSEWCSYALTEESSYETSQQSAVLGQQTQKHNLAPEEITPFSQRASKLADLKQVRN